MLVLSAFDDLFPLASLPTTLFTPPHPLQTNSGLVFVVFLQDGEVSELAFVLLPLLSTPPPLLFGLPCRLLCSPQALFFSQCSSHSAPSDFCFLLASSILDWLQQCLCSEIRSLSSTCTRILFFCPLSQSSRPPILTPHVVCMLFLQAAVFALSA